MVPFLAPTGSLEAWIGFADGINSATPTPTRLEIHAPINQIGAISDQRNRPSFQPSEVVPPSSLSRLARQIPAFFFVFFFMYVFCAKQPRKFRWYYPQALNNII